MALRFGTDGVRGRALTELTLDDAAAVARAAAEVLGATRWLIGRDTRESGPALEAAVAAGLHAAGASPESVGVVPTPALAVLSAAWSCPAAMITASHNPYHDNGIKIFAAGGAKLSDDTERAIEAAIRPTPSEPPAVRRVDGIEVYADRLVAMFPPDALRGCRVVLDCANGAMSDVAPVVARRLGAEVVVLHAEPDGRNINAECGATATGSLAAAVPAHGAHLGLAFDGDGDRVIAIDERGEVVDGDRLIALGALHLRSLGALRHDTVVVTVMSNLGFHRAMTQAGIHVEVTPVGDRFVLERLAAGPYSIGGEQSGHIVYPDAATTGDGLLAGLRLAHHVHQRGVGLHRLAAEVMTRFPQVLVNVHVAARHPHIADELADEIAAAEHELGDDGRVLVRASGTEPLVRVMVEAATDDVARRVAQHLADIVRHRFA